MSTYTAASVLTDHGYTPSAMEFPDLDIPVLSASQRQGDVLVLATDTPWTNPAIRPIGSGVEVVRAEAGGNTHCLHGDGEWLPQRATGSLVQGWLRVPDGGVAFLIHTEEHSALGIGAGTYEIRRQREFAGEWRRVAD